MVAGRSKEARRGRVAVLGAAACSRGTSGGMLRAMGPAKDIYCRGIKSIEVGGRLLAALTAAREPMPLRELARATQMSPSKAHRYLSSFAVVGLVEQDEATREYRLGSFAFEMGLAAIGSSDPLNDAIQVQGRLRDELDRTIILSVWGTHGPTVLRIEESSDPVVMTMKIGAALPLMHTAAGRIFGAFMPRRVIEGHLKAPVFGGVVGGRRVRYRDIEPELESLRRAGFACSSGEMLKGVDAIAAPLLSPQGQLVAVLAVIGQHNSLDMSAGGVMAKALLRVADEYRKATPAGAPSPVRTAGAAARRSRRPGPQAAL